MSNVYFSNSVNDTVSVNINSGLQNHEMTARTTTTDSNKVVTVVNCAAVQIPTGPNKGKDVFGTGGGSNTVVVEFNTLEADPQSYTVTPENLSGRDLYIYVFDGTIVGQDDTGRPFSIGGAAGDGSVVAKD